MDRFIYRQLRQWKHKEDRKPLIMLGARQVGKTWIMRNFGKEEYDAVAYINCDEEARAQQMFENDYDISRILFTVQDITGVVLKPQTTLLLLDEIQEVPRGLHSLKYFYEKAPEYHVMVAGSLLGLTLNKGESFPVGKVDMLHMYPMSFGEFLLATGNKQLHNLLASRNWQAIDVMRDKLEHLFRQYYYVGGMPKVVALFVQTNDLSKVRKEQMAIIEAYRNDISKHTTTRESTRIGQVLAALPSQLARENKKFIYKTIKKGARAVDFELAIQWLVDAGIVHRVHKVNKATLPLKFYESLDAFKLFLLDCGLLACMVDAPASQLLIDSNAFVEFKGALTEQYVLQQLVASGIIPYYWSNDRTPMEIDFVIQFNDEIRPIEVKATTNVRSKSLSQFIKNNPQLKGIRISLNSYVDQDWMTNVPLYAIEYFFNDYSDEAMKNDM